MGYTKWFNEQSKAVKIIIMIPFWGWIFGFIYRLFDFLESKETAVLLGAILFIIPITGFVLSIVDIVTIITDEKIKFFVTGGENFGISGTIESSEEKKEEAPKAEETKTEEETK